MARRTRRSARVDELLRERVAEIVREIRDPRVGFVTIMDVSTSPDLRHARVYFSVLGDDDERAETLQALRNASGWVQGRVAEQVRLRYHPRIEFVLDHTLEQAARMDELIAEMRADVEGDPAAGDEAPPEDPGEEAGGEPSA